MPSYAASGENRQVLQIGENLYSILYTQFHHYQFIIEKKLRAVAPKPQLEKSVKRERPYQYCIGQTIIRMHDMLGGFYSKITAVDTTKDFI